jgi:Uma2 family endonuclease
MKRQKPRDNRKKLRRWQFLEWEPELVTEVLIEEKERKTKKLNMMWKRVRELLKIM